MIEKRAAVHGVYLDLHSRRRGWRGSSRASALAVIEGLDLAAAAGAITTLILNRGRQREWHERLDGFRIAAPEQAEEAFHDGGEPERASEDARQQVPRGVQARASAGFRHCILNESLRILKH